MKATIAVGCTILLLFLVIFVWRDHLRVNQISTLQSTIVRLQSDRDGALARAAEERRKRVELEQTQANPAANSPPQKDQAFEDVLTPWLTRAQKLAAFADSHPQWKIPQMNLLTTEDWLVNAREGRFESEADYREALARLRGVVRLKTANSISASITSALAASAGVLPVDVQAFKGYLAPDIDPGVLSLLELNPTGTIPGVYSSSPQKYVVVEKPVDELFDLTYFYSEGGYGSRGGSAPRQVMIEAMADYTRKNGVAPTSAEQLTYYPALQKLDPKIRQALYEAITTKVP